MRDAGLNKHTNLNNGHITHREGVRGRVVLTFAVASKVLNEMLLGFTSQETRTSRPVNISARITPSQRYPRTKSTRERHTVHAA